MTESAFLMGAGHLCRVKPIRVLFGGLECEAIEIIERGDAAGVYIRTMPRMVEFVPLSAEPLALISPTARIGELRCERCGLPFRFAEDGRVFSFPFSPLPGWFVWNPGVLSGIAGDGQEIKPRVRCAACVRKLDDYVRLIFQSGIYP